MKFRINNVRSAPAWNKGNVTEFQQGTSFIEAVNHIAGDLKFEKVHLTTDKYVSPVYGIFKKDSGQFLESCSKDWQLIQYTDIAQTLSSLTDHFQIETAGVTGIGEGIFVALNATPYNLEIEGKVRENEQMKGYILLLLSNLPGRAHKILHTDVRVACWNALGAAHNQAQINLSIPHTHNMEIAFEFVRQLVVAEQKMSDKSKELFEAMAHKKITERDLKAILAKVYKQSKPKSLASYDNFSDAQFKSTVSNDYINVIDRDRRQYESNVNRMENHRDNVIELYNKFNDEHSYARETVFASYMALTEYIDHRIGRDDEDVSKSLLFGSRNTEKRKAFKACVGLI